MATFVEVVQASGAIKIKAICRVWREGKQVSKSKTFTTMEEAELWAGDVEQSMQVEIAREKLEKVSEPVSEFKPFDRCETIGDLIKNFAVSLKNLQAMSNESFLLLRSEDFENYFERRIKKEGASEAEIEVEIDLIYSMFRFRDQATGNRETNLVQMALTALRTRGVMN